MGASWNRQDRVTICSSLLCHLNSDPFFNRIVTGDEKWITYENVLRKVVYCLQPESSTSKRGLHPKKVMLSIWWDVKVPIHYELLKQNQNINSAKYCEQLDKHDQKIKKTRPALANRSGDILQSDNVRPHVSLATQKKIVELGWEVLGYPPYFPDLAPSNFHLFLSL